jgi:hypothetical protein
MEYKLHHWSIENNFDNNIYLAPEQCKTYLIGTRDTDNKMVKTSSISNVNGTTITTKTGSVYILGEIDPDYLKWMTDNHIPYNKDNPIKVVKNG